MSRYRLLSITAGTVSISITKYIAKRKIVHGTKLTNFQNRFTATDSPVDFILLNFSLFSPFNRVNLWYFSIIFCFYFSDSYSMFEKVHPTVTVNLLLKRDQSEPCRDSKLTMHGNLNMYYESEK